MGTISDRFQFTAQEGSERDRFMVFGRTPDDFGSACFTPYTNQLVGCSYRWWEPGEWGPEGGAPTTGVVHPFPWDTAVVHWVRHYERGTCSAEWSSDDVRNLWLGIVEGLADRFGEAGEVDVLSSRIRFRLGVPPSEELVPDARNHDFIDMVASFSVDPWVKGWWHVTVAASWRFVVGTRSKYLYCGDGHDCDEHPYLPCVTDEDCEAYVHGAKCTAYATPEEPGVCYKGPVLEVADYEFDYAVGESHCPPGELICQKYYDAIRDGLAHIKAEPYRGFFLPMLQEVEKAMWKSDPDLMDLFYISPPGCTSDAECWDKGGAMFGPNLDWKCDVAPQGGDWEGRGYRTACYARPTYIWGVNQYPDGLEFVLLFGSRGHSEWALFQAANLCVEGSEPKWSDVENHWVDWSL